MFGGSTVLSTAAGSKRVHPPDTTLGQPKEHRLHSPQEPAIPVPCVLGGASQSLGTDGILPGHGINASAAQKTVHPTQCGQARVTIELSSNPPQYYCNYLYC